MDLFEHGVFIQPVSKSLHKPPPGYISIQIQAIFKHTRPTLLCKEMLAKRPLFLGYLCLLVNSRLLSVSGSRLQLQTGDAPFRIDTVISF